MDLLVSGDRSWLRFGIKRSTLFSIFFLIAFVGCDRGSIPTVAVVTPIQAADEEPARKPLFEDKTKDTGINFTYRNDEEANHFASIEFVGGGVALVDFDRDGKLDLFAAAGGYYTGHQVNGYPCRLFRNLGNWKFEDVTDQILPKGPWCYSHGVTATDYNNDGWPDLLITGYNRLHLLRNESSPSGGRRFVDVTQEAGLTEVMWSTTAGFGDLDGDGFPDLYVSHYGDWGFETNHPIDCTYRDNVRDVCQPQKFKPLPHQVYRNNGNGTFTNITDKLNLRKDGKGLGVLLVDVNNDGKPDIFAANDTDPDFLYINQSRKGAIQLEEKAALAGCALDGRGRPTGSMGVDAADFNRTGRASILVTTYEDELPSLHRNDCSDGRINFCYATNSTGMGAMGGNYVSWGVGWIDLEHRGWEDAVIVNGHAIRFPAAKYGRQQKPVLLRNEKGRFKAISNDGGEYFRSLHNARGVAFGDIDNDGNTDMVISHLNEPLTLLRNISRNENHWIGIELVGADARDYVGARVVLEGKDSNQTRFAKGGGSYASSSDRRMVFGLGLEPKVGKIKIYWPFSEKVQEIEGLEADSYYRINEGNAEIKKIP